MATALEHLVALSRGLVADSSRVAAREDREPQKSKAVRLLMEMGAGNITAVAKAVGVTPRTLYRWPETRMVMDRLRAVEMWEMRQPRAVRPGEV